LYRGNLTRETERYWLDSKAVCAEKQRDGVSVQPWDSYIPERVDIKRSIPGRYFPSDFEEHFAKLWNNIEGVLR